jgi:anti-sigma factor RsiW
VNTIEEALEMDSCSQHTLDILRYLDHQLNCEELKAFFAHLLGCQSCRARTEEEQALSRLLGDSRPLFPAPIALRARVSAVLKRPPARYRRLKRLYGSFLPQARRSVRGMAQWGPGWSLAVPAVLVIAMVFVFLSIAAQQVSAASYVSAAVAAHRSYLDGNLPPEIESGSPDVVTAWFSDKLPFSFRLPSAQPDLASGSAYRLIGARLVDYHNNHAALVSYQTARKEAISLLVTSTKLAAVEGGDEVRSGVLTFHYRTDNGFKVITWINSGLAYALVSDVAGSPRASCLVCHQNMADHNAFKARP